MATNEQHWTFREQEEEVMADIFRTMADAELTAKYDTNAKVRKTARTRYRKLLEGLAGDKWSTLTLIPPTLTRDEKEEYDQALKSHKEKEKEKEADDQPEAAETTDSKGKQLSDTIRRLAKHEHARTAVQALLEMGSYFRQDATITKIMVLDTDYFGVYGGVSGVNV